MKIASAVVAVTVGVDLFERDCEDVSSVVEDAKLGVAAKDDPEDGKVVVGDCESVFVVSFS